MINTKRWYWKSMIKKVLVLAAATGCFFTAGCSFDGSPHSRVGYTPNCCFGDPQRLGTHSYTTMLGEGNGILYTLRGGSIDLDHLRTASDLTKYAYDKCYAALLKNKKKFTVSPTLELTWNHVEIHYPENWDKIPPEEKNKIMPEVALAIGKYIGFHSTIWHEMLTWKGTHFALLEPEFNSAFSWEDVYSNALGVNLAAEAISDPHNDYDAAMTALLQKQLEILEVVPQSEAKRITRSVRGNWYKGDIIPDTIRRNFDMGYDDGTIDPSIIPGFSDKEPIPTPAVHLDVCKKYGFAIHYTVTSWYLETLSLKRDAQTGWKDVEPEKDFPGLIDKYKKEALEKYGYQVDD